MAQFVKHFSKPGVTVQYDVPHETLRCHIRGALERHEAQVGAQWLTKEPEKVMVFQPN